MVRNCRGPALVHEEEVHSFHVLPPAPSLFHERLPVHGPIHPHLPHDACGGREGSEVLSSGPGNLKVTQARADQAAAL